MSLLIFRIEDVTQLDINDLIDKGHRFNLVSENEEQSEEAIRVKEYIENETIVKVPSRCRL